MKQSPKLILANGEKYVLTLPLLWKRPNLTSPGWRHVLLNLPNWCFFCDASKTIYGFCAYIKQSGKSNLLFAKSKLAPEPSKKLPSLDLLSVYMALKCLAFMIIQLIFHSICVILLSCWIVKLPLTGSFLLMIISHQLHLLLMLKSQMLGLTP